MASISEPYDIHYSKIVAMADPTGENVELVEFFECIGGTMWTKLQYAKSPIVKGVRTVGPTTRYLVKSGSVDLELEGSRFPAGISGCLVSKDEIAVSYLGLGGGGVGAAGRAGAGGVLRSRSDPSGGGKIASSTIWLPRYQRVLIGVDDTDTPEKGATWTLVHNIAKNIENDNTIYLSHTIVQLFPVPYRTKNCVSIVAEFATNDPENLVKRFHELLEKYTLSNKTGMAVYTGFTPSQKLLVYGWAVKRGEVTPDLLENVQDPDLRIIMKGRGITGAVAAIPFYTNFEEALELCCGKN